MKHIKKILFMVFCMPLALFGLFAAGTDEEPPAGSKDDGKPNDPPAAEGAGDPTADDLPKSQAELDALIEKRLARERKKMAKQQPSPAAQPPAAGDPPATQPAADNSAELATMQRDLLTAKAQLTAINTVGIRADMAEDAVYLAVRKAEQDGDLDEEAVTDALKGVLKRHPEWKKDAGGDGKPGFRVGAGGGQQTGAANDALDEIFGLKKPK